MSVLPFALLAGAVATLVLSLAWFQSVLDPSEMTRDALAAAQQRVRRDQYCCSPLLGAVSTLGVVLWAAASAMATIAALVLARIGAPAAWVAAMAVGAALSLWLALDDGFMLHETQGVRILDVVGLYKGVTAILLTAMVALLAVGRATAGWPLLAVAVALLSASVLIDDNTVPSPGAIFVEDAAKFGGIAFWAAYFLHASAASILAAVDVRPARRRPWRRAVPRSHAASPAAADRPRRDA